MCHAFKVSLAIYIVIFGCILVNKYEYGLINGFLCV